MTRDEKIAKMFNDGIDPDLIADRFSLSRSRVLQIIKKEGEKK